MYSTTISAQILDALASTGKVAIIECSFDLADPAAGRRSFENGHIPGAHYLHLDEDLSSPASAADGRHPLPDVERLEQALRAAGVDAGQQVVAYDGEGGPYAARLWWLLRWLGHDAVAVLDGGKAAWREAGFAFETGAADPAEGSFAARSVDSDRTVLVDDVLDNIGKSRFLVIDARSPERFRGDPNPLDPVSGHIPGARNRFFKDNLSADGRFKPSTRLKAEFLAVLGETDPAHVVLQCGSGITACHNALALEIAGLGGAKLYPGSWSQWISDPARPIETG